MAEHDDREQRTEEATPRRRDEARERGQVPLSSELVSAVGLAVALGCLAAGGAQLARAVAAQMEQGLRGLGRAALHDLSVRESAALLEGSLTAVMGALGAVVVPAVLACALAGYVQVGLRFAPKALEIDPGKLDPLRGMQRVFSARGLVRTAFALAKVLLISAV